MRISHWALLFLLGCSNDDEIADKQRECDGIAANIRSAAARYGVPAVGVCNNQSVAVPFAMACANLQRCNSELADLKD